MLVELGITLRRGGPSLWLALTALVASAGCVQGTAPPESIIRGSMPDTHSESAPDLLVVPATQVWSETGINVESGQTITLTARGEIIAGPARSGSDAPVKIPPEGTFLWDDRAQDRLFPLSLIHI